MLRIECSCTKTLKFDETLLGRKIKCPVCGAVQVAKAPAHAGTSARSRTSPEADLADDPPPPSKKGKPGKESAAPKGDGKEKKAKKGGPILLWLLIGVGALVLIGGGIYVVLFVYPGFLAAPKPAVKKYAPPPGGHPTQETPDADQDINKDKQPGGEKPAPKAKLPDDSSQKPGMDLPPKDPVKDKVEPLHIELGLVQVEWLEGQSAVPSKNVAQGINRTQPRFLLAPFLARSRLWETTPGR